MNTPSEYEVALDQTPAPSPEPSDGEMVAMVLEDNGVPASPELVRQLERLIYRCSFRLASEGWRRLLRTMGKRPVNRALERVILGDGGKSLADDAGEVGCTKQGLAYHENKARKCLAYLTAAALTETHERKPISASGQRGRRKAGHRSRR